MAESIFPWLHLVGRILFSLFLIVFGLMHLFSPRVAEYFDSKEIPGPRVVASAMGVMVLVGGVFLLLGWHRFIGAGLAQVRFIATLSDGEESERHHRIATIAYAYEPDASVPLSALADNALGFAVREYRSEPEDAS